MGKKNASCQVRADAHKAAGIIGQGLGLAALAAAFGNNNESVMILRQRIQVRQLSPAK